MHIYYFQNKSLNVGFCLRCGNKTSCANAQVVTQSIVFRPFCVKIDFIDDR